MDFALKRSSKTKARFIKKAFFTSTDHRGYKLWSCQNVFDALSYLLDNIYIRFGFKLYRQIEGVSARTWLSPFLEKNLRYYHIKVHYNKTYNLIYSLLYLPTSLALEMLFYQIVSVWLSPSNDEVLVQERG